MEIKKAERKGTPALVGLWGPSYSGKTMSALLVARGLVGPTGKIGMIDTENRRGEDYAQYAGGWDHLDLQPPFTPERYEQAFKKFEDAGGYGCVIVDTTSHVWEGEGGVLDAAEKIGGFGLQKWNKPKMNYKRMLNYLMRAPFHVIFCVRAKEGVVQKGKGKDAEIEHIGLVPIAEKNFIYEMTVAVLLGPDHKPLTQPIGRFFPSPIIPAIKVPDELQGMIKPGEYLSERVGADIAKWKAGGAGFDTTVLTLRRDANDKAMQGTPILEAHWNTLTKDQKQALLPSMSELKAIAAEADAEIGKALDGGEPEPADQRPFSDQFTDGAGPDVAEQKPETAASQDQDSDQPPLPPIDHPKLASELVGKFEKAATAKALGNIKVINTQDLARMEQERPDLHATVMEAFTKREKWFRR